MTTEAQYQPSHFVPREVQVVRAEFHDAAGCPEPGEWKWGIGPGDQYQAGMRGKVVQKVFYLLMAFWLGDLLIVVECKYHVRTVRDDLVDESWQEDFFYIRLRDPW